MRGLYADLEEILKGKAGALIGANIAKLRGDSFGAQLSFKYLGPQITVWVGIGLSYGQPTGHATPFVYAMKQMTVGPNSTATMYYATVTGTIPTNATLGKYLDAQRFISDSQPVVGQQPPNPYGVNNWDDEVYVLPEVTFSDLTVVTYT